MLLGIRPDRGKAGVQVGVIRVGVRMKDCFRVMEGGRVRLSDTIPSGARAGVTGHTHQP